METLDNRKTVTQHNGLYYLLNGFSLIVQPGLKRFVLIPLLINVLLFIGLFFLLQHVFTTINHWFLHFLPHWLQWIGSILWGLFFISFFLVLVYTFVTLANLISAPFNSLLAEKIEAHLTGKRSREQSFSEMIKDTPRVLSRQFAMIKYYLPRALVLLCLFFIPVIQIVAAFIWFLFSAWFMTIQYIDYPSDNQRVPFHEVRQQLGQNRWDAFTFGISILVLMMVPFLNLIVMPAAVAGATQWWIEKIQRQINIK